MNLIYNWNKQDKLKLIFYQPSKEVIVPWAQSPQQFFLRNYPWLIWPRWVPMCCSFRVVTISLLRVLNRVSVWAVKVDEEQSKVTFLVSPFFSPSFFSMFLCLKVTIGDKMSWDTSPKIRLFYVLWTSKGGNIAFLPHPLRTMLCPCSSYL